MTINGSLLAYTTPTEIKSLRNQAAIVSLTWKEQHGLRLNVDVSRPHSPSPLDMYSPQTFAIPDQTMIVEMDKCNLIARCLSSRILLVMEGGVPPNHKAEPKVTLLEPASAPTSQNSTADTETQDNLPAKQPAAGQPSGLLNVHREKFDAVAMVIEAQLAKSGFQMPAGPDDGYF